ncbi:MAG: hypothetical protein M1818_007747 [Claussenomyces sp. TS43310]|nr:MAG: hypothetical protein M1818_007747 [Claussenomyces sp. TS43310]
MSGPKPSHAFVASARQKRKRDITEFATDLQATINKALPLVSLGYRRVAVLAISWSNDTMSVKTTEKELLDVFQNWEKLANYFHAYSTSYGFVVENFVIQASLKTLQAITALQKRIIKFYEDWDREDSLTIYVYSGHGALVEGGNTKKYLIA